MQSGGQTTGGMLAQRGGAGMAGPIPKGRRANPVRMGSRMESIRSGEKV